MIIDKIFYQEIALGDVIIYMDNILIATKGSLEKHKLLVIHILNKLYMHNLYLKPKKYIFHKEEVDYLCVIVGNRQVKMDSTKVQVITNWPQLTKVKEVHSFLGFGNFYKDFILLYSQIA